MACLRFGKACLVDIKVPGLVVQVMELASQLGSQVELALGLGRLAESHLLES